MQLIVESSPAEAARTAALLVAQAIRRADGPFDLGLAGGSTPRTAYFVLRQLDVPWHRVTCWLPDERYVPRHDPESNARCAREDFVDHVGVPLLEVDTTLPPTEAAAAYWGRLTTLFHEGAPRLVMLGMGGDGHTASLFPGTAALAEAEPGYVANWVEQLDCWRLTATMPLLTSADHVLFLVTGDHKADTVRAVLEDGDPYPAQQVTAEAQQVTWIVDAAAASQLRDT